MLSPNATIRVKLNLGGGCTTTLNEHDADRCRASVAVHVTDAVPMLKTDPLVGVQLVVTGGAPSVTIGVKVTVAPWAVVACCGAGAGHEIWGASGTVGGGGVGSVGAEQRLEIRAATTTSGNASEWKIGGRTRVSR